MMGPSVLPETWSRGYSSPLPSLLPFARDALNITWNKRSRLLCKGKAQNKVHTWVYDSHRLKRWHCFNPTQEKTKLPFQGLFRLAPISVLTLCIPSSHSCISHLDLPLFIKMSGSVSLEDRPLAPLCTLCLALILRVKLLPACLSYTAFKLTCGPSSCTQHSLPISLSAGPTVLYQKNSMLSSLPSRL